MSSRTMFNYASQLSTALNAGLPLDRVLGTLARTAPTKRLKTVSADVNRSIASGSTLAGAFGEHNRLFPDFFIRMIEVGETTGRLEQVAKSLSSHYGQRYTTLRAVRRELYPILAYFALLTGLVLLIQWLTHNTAALASLVEILAWVALGLAVLWAAHTFSRPFRHAEGSLLFHFPFVQRLVRKFCLARFCEAMGLAVEAGLHLGEAIRLSSESSGNPAFRKRALRAAEHIEKGSSISQGLEKTGLFPFEAMQMFIVGEEAGKLHETMGHVSKLARERAVEGLHLTLVMGIRALYVLLLLYIAYKVITFYSGIYRRTIDEFNPFGFGC